MYYQKLKKQLFVDIDYPRDLTDLIGDAKPWVDFYKLPQDTKDKFCIPTVQKETDIGYFRRSKSEGRDDKEFFHIYPNMRDFIRKNDLQETVEGNQALKEFFKYAEKVYKKVNDFALSIGKEMGQEISELGELVSKGEINSVLRLLHYTNPDLEILGQQHFDRSLYTLHLYESAPGLQFLDYDMKWKDAPIGNGKTVVFNGYRNEILSKGDLQKTWHRVVRKGDFKDRISLVLFMWSKQIESYDQEARSQNFTPSYSK